MPKLPTISAPQRHPKQQLSANNVYRDNSGKHRQASFAAIPTTMPYQQHPMTQITPRLIAALRTH